MLAGPRKTRILRACCPQPETGSGFIVVASCQFCGCRCFNRPTFCTNYENTPKHQQPVHVPNMRASYCGLIPCSYTFGIRFIGNTSPQLQNKKNLKTRAIATVIDTETFAPDTVEEAQEAAKESSQQPCKKIEPPFTELTSWCDVWYKRTRGYRKQCLQQQHVLRSPAAHAWGHATSHENFQ